MTKVLETSSLPGPISIVNQYSRLTKYNVEFLKSQCPLPTIVMGIRRIKFVKLCVLKYNLSWKMSHVHLRRMCVVLLLE